LRVNHIPVHFYYRNISTLEVFMRFRSSLITLACYLAFTTLACTSKPPANDANNPANTSDANNPSNAGNSADPGSSGGGSNSGRSTSRSRSASEMPSRLVVPSGTVLTVRLGETLSSKQSQPGQTFTASTVNPIEVEGKTVVPAGATATGTVVAAHPAGKFKGASLLQIKLDSITIGGKQHNIDTSSVERSEKGKGKRTATMIGGGAGAGALIGALVGGGAGTAGSAFTGNRDVTLPAESALSFKLEAPLEVTQ
jgi:hypothetical protein